MATMRVFKAPSVLLRAESQLASRPAALMQSRAASQAGAAYRRCCSPKQISRRRPESAVFTSGSFQSIRWHTAPPTRPQVYEFAEVQKISDSPSAERILIDVREPSEYAEGYIPTAINLPIKTQPDALFLPEEEFEDRFKFEKPSVDAEVIFYCKSGVRSNAAAQLARQSGYTNVSEYRGSWLDWAKNGGSTAKP